MPGPDQKTVLEALKAVTDPETRQDIVAAGMVSSVFANDGRVAFSITVPAEKAEGYEAVRKAAERVVQGIPGVTRAMVALTAERRPVAGAAQPPRPQAAGPRQTPAHGHGHGGRARPSELAPAKPGIPGVKQIIAVASGKGGVGKSTTAVNLALALKARGMKVGLLDADVYGPSIPRLLGLKGRPKVVSGRVLAPMEAYGLKVMSIGFLVEEETPMIWRGPMVMQALSQMMREVAWGDLDLMVVDMPPGTGDAQLTMAQQVPLAGAVIVSTPQDLALIDARKGLAMFRKVEVPVLGIVENMSTFICPVCGTRHDIFGHGGARQEAERLGVPFLGEIPLVMEIRETSDSGQPVVAVAPEGPHAAAYAAVAAAVAGALESATGAQRPAPRIVIE